jgi:hypothetical protein
VSGLGERIERKLGLSEEERLIVVEHVLLAPLREDNIPPSKAARGFLRSDRADRPGSPDLADPAAIAPGTPAKIVVRATAAGDRYQLALVGKPIGQARDGDRNDLILTTPPVSQSTSFQVLVTRPAEPGIPVQRTVQIVVMVAPPA